MNRPKLIGAAFVCALLIVVSPFVYREFFDQSPTAQARRVAKLIHKTLPYDIRGTWHGTVVESWQMVAPDDVFRAEYHVTLKIADDCRIEQLSWTHEYNPYIRSTYTWLPASASVQHEARENLELNAPLLLFDETTRSGNLLSSDISRPDKGYAFRLNRLPLGDYRDSSYGGIFRADENKKGFTAMISAVIIPRGTFALSTASIESASLALRSWGCLLTTDDGSEVYVTDYMDELQRPNIKPRAYQPMSVRCKPAIPLSDLAEATIRIDQADFTDAGRLALLEPRDHRRITSVALSVQKARLESDGYIKEAEVIFRSDGTKLVRIKNRRLHNDVPLEFPLEKRP